MNRPRMIPVALFLGLCVFASPGLVRADVFDQDNTFTPIGCSSVNGCALGQTFRPALSRIDFFDLRMCFLEFTVSPEPVDYVLWLHEGTFGPVVGVSDTVQVSTPGQTYRFMFSGISLVPGSTYYVSFHQLNGSGRTGNWGVYMCQNCYAGGALYLSCGGAPDGAYDTWFREGIFDPVPVNPTSWGHIKAFYR